MSAAASPTLPSPAISSPLAVDLDGVSRRFGSPTAVERIEIHIPAGQTVALLGPNGAGKSTAISVMLGLLAPSEGSARLFGGPPRAAVSAGRVGAMLQAGTLPAGATVGELVDLARAMYPAPLARDAVLERAGLTSLERRRADALSGGEAQRVRFALAIAGDPDLLFLDEPTVAMDVETRRAFWADLRRAASEGRTILFATHHLDEADQVADRIVIIDGGRIVADGTPAALKASVSLRSVRFALDEADHDEELRALPMVASLRRTGAMVSLESHDADATVRAIVGAGIPFRHLEVSGADLDAAFLFLTAAPPAA